MRALALLPTAALMFLLLAPTALADSSEEVVSGEGLYGPADDKVVTNAGFLIIIFVPLFILTMSLIQARLEKRKDARKAAAKRVKSEWGNAGW
jgi:flagellar biosynthesis/type III secretory pathway M-ring protein FliF/YscJ